MKKSKVGGRKLQLNRETLLRFDPQHPAVIGAVATGTCAGSGCAECKTVHGTGCMSKAGCQVDEDTGTIIVLT